MDLHMDLADGAVVEFNRTTQMRKCRVTVVNVKMSGLAASFSAVVRTSPAIDDFSASRAPVLSFLTDTTFSAAISAVQIECSPK
jgi:hypothetical protein